MKMPLFKDLEQIEKDRFFMKAALKEAEAAFAVEEVPVGAVLVINDKIVARGHNQVEMLKDATAHAEMLCLTSASSAIGNWRLNESVLYCTLEPCIMCAGAMLSSRIKRLVWAAKDLRLGANGSWIDIFSHPHPFHSIEVDGGVLEEESTMLLQEFFKKIRKKKNVLV